VRRLEAKAVSYEVICIMVTFVEPDGSERVPHVLLPGEGTRPATAAEIAGEGAVRLLCGSFSASTAPLTLTADHRLNLAPAGEASLRAMRWWTYPPATTQ
jgi:hypothetical protein